MIELAGTQKTPVIVLNGRVVKLDEVVAFAAGGSNNKPKSDKKSDFRKLLTSPIKKGKAMLSLNHHHNNSPKTPRYERSSMKDLFPHKSSGNDEDPRREKYKKSKSLQALITGDKGEKLKSPKGSNKGKQKHHGSDTRAQLLALNTTIHWDRVHKRKGLEPPRKDLDAMGTLLDACQQIGSAMREGPGGKAFAAFEEAVNRLQLVDVTTLPESTRAKLAFGLNLFNLMVLHAVVLKKDSWPRSLPDMLKFFETINYSVGGKLINLRELRTSLLGEKPKDNKSSVLPKNAKQKKKRRRQQMSLLLSMSLGTYDSPQINIFEDPKSLHTDLDIMAKSFIRDKVYVHNDQLYIPELLTIYPEFGTKPRKVLERIIEFLSQEQYEEIYESSEKLTLEILPHDWAPLEFEVHQQAAGQHKRTSLPSYDNEEEYEDFDENGSIEISLNGEAGTGDGDSLGAELSTSFANLFSWAAESATSYVVDTPDGEPREKVKVNHQVSAISSMGDATNIEDISDPDSVEDDTDVVDPSDDLIKDVPTISIPQLPLS